MKKTQKRRNKHAWPKQLGFEQLESRTVLSATNLLATAFEMAPRLDTRVELPGRPAVVAAQVRQLTSAAADVPREWHGDRFQAVFNRGETRIDVNGPAIPWPGTTSTEPSRSPRNMPLAFLEFNGDGVSRDGMLSSARLLTVAGTTALTEARVEILQAKSQFFYELASDSPTRPFEAFDAMDQRTDGLSIQFSRCCDLETERSDLEQAGYEESLSPLGHEADAAFDNTITGGQAVPFDPLAAIRVDGVVISQSEPRSAVPEVIGLASDLMFDRLIELPSSGIGESRATWTPSSADSASNDVDASSFGKTTVGIGKSPARFDRGWLMSDDRDGNDVLSPDSLTDGSLTDVGDRTEDRLVDIDQDRSDDAFAGRRRIASPIPANHGWWRGATERRHDAFWIEFSDESDSTTVADLQRDPIGETVDAEPPDDADITTMAATHDIDHEGGMIELIASSDPRAAECHVESVESSHAFGPSPARVRMDTGIVFFQVLDVATGPWNPADIAEHSTRDRELPSAATAVNTSNELPTVERAAAVEFPTVERAAVVADHVGVAPVRAAAVPALLAAAAALFRWRRIDDDRLRRAGRGGVTATSAGALPACRAKPLGPAREFAGCGTGC